jgi:hypothetical protein
LPRNDVSQRRSTRRTRRGLPGCQPSA